MASDPRPLQFTLWQLTAAMFWLCAALGLIGWWPELGLLVTFVASCGLLLVGGWRLSRGGASNDVPPVRLKQRHLWRASARQAAAPRGSWRQFSLSRLMALITLACLLAAVYSWFGPRPYVVVGYLGLIVLSIAPIAIALGLLLAFIVWITGHGWR